MCVCPSPYVVGLGDTHGGPLRHIRPRGQDQEEDGHMHPVQPGWVACPVPNPSGEWFHVVGWTAEMQPVCAGQDRGVFVWRSEFGEDPFLIGTYDEWVG